MLGNSNGTNNVDSCKRSKDIPLFNVSVKVLNARNIKDTDMKAPLLPPDKITIAGSMFDVLDPVIGRTWYKKLAKDDYNCSKTRQECVIGSYYCSLYDQQLSNIIDWNETKDIDIKVMLKNNELTYINVRKCTSDLSKCILLLHNRL